jgi:hypothetical protein
VDWSGSGQHRRHNRDEWGWVPRPRKRKGTTKGCSGLLCGWIYVGRGD